MERKRVGLAKSNIEKFFGKKARVGLNEFAPADVDDSDSVTVNACLKNVELCNNCKFNFLKF